ncbi:hypothetical protein ACJMK2_022232 [Sinanodonta woodiana]|uniref:Membrane progestin receptor gamma n=1 Tax=Sinanodonta woodiana TaxID=1069815 RepID=A0ABD3TIE9_SINWO
MFTAELSGTLYHVDQVPEHFKELFILRGYRHPKSTATQCILSVFAATNETLNFWTHFLPSWYFLWVLMGLAETLDFIHDTYTWPLLAYMVVCCIFPLASATAHTFNSMSVKARHICFFLDYGALSLTSFAVALVYKAYVFPNTLRDTWFGNWFLCIAAVNAIICTTYSCETRFMKPSVTRTVIRLGAFALPYIYDSAPVIYRLLAGTPEEMALQSSKNHFFQFIFAFISASIYGSHFPERLSPGSFDIIGHSHQIFHVCTILGTMQQMQGILLDMQERRDLLLPNFEFHDLYDSIGRISLIMVINVFIIVGFSFRLLKKIDVKS